MSIPVSDPVVKARKLLGHFPPGTADAAVEFFETRSPAALDRTLLGVIRYYLPAPSDSWPDDLSGLPGTTSLVKDLRIDSLTIAEMAFLIEDLLSLKLADEELQTLATLDDLRAVLRRKLNLT